MTLLVAISCLLAMTSAQSISGRDSGPLFHDRQFMPGFCPAFVKIFDSYPGYDTYPSDQLLAKLGKGKLAWITNTCAVRTTIALNGVGQDAGRMANTRWTDGVQQYIIRVKTMDRYLRAVYGEPYIVAGRGEKLSNGLWLENEAVRDKVGIIKYSECGWSDASGHFDVWDGRLTKGHGYPERCGKVELWNVCNPRSKPDFSSLQKFARDTNAARSSRVSSRGWFGVSHRSEGHEFWAPRRLGIAGLSNSQEWAEASRTSIEECPDKEPFWERGDCFHNVEERTGTVQRRAREECCKCPETSQVEVEINDKGYEVCVTKKGILREITIVGRSCCGLSPLPKACDSTDCIRDRTNEAREAQKLLKVAADGIFGKNSKAALRTFQRTKGFEVTRCLTECALNELRETRLPTKWSVCV